MPRQKAVCIMCMALTVPALTCSAYDSVKSQDYVILSGGPEWVELKPFNYVVRGLHQKAQLKFTLDKGKPLQYDEDCWDHEMLKVKVFYNNTHLTIRRSNTSGDDVVDAPMIDCPRPTKQTMAGVDWVEGDRVDDGTPLFKDWLNAWDDILDVEGRVPCIEEQIKVCCYASFDGENWTIQEQAPYIDLYVTFQGGPPDLQVDSDNDGGINDDDDPIELNLPGKCIPIGQEATMILDVKGIPPDRSRARLTYDNPNIQIWDISGSTEKHNGDTITIPTNDWAFWFQVKGIAPGTAIITVDVDLDGNTFFDDGAAGQDSVRVTVVGVDMDMEDVPENEEDAPGGFVSLDQLKELIIRCPWPSTIDRTVWLSAARSGTGDIAVWADEARNQSISLSSAHAFVPGPGSSITLYVEGTTASSPSEEGDIILTLSHPLAGSDTITLTVKGLAVNVDRVIKDGSNPEEPDESGILHVALGSTVSLRAIPDPPGAVFPTDPVVQPTWTHAPGEATLTYSTTEGPTTTLSDFGLGTYTIHAICNGIHKTIQLSVGDHVYVDRIIKEGSNPEDQGPLYVGKDGSVTLEAIPSPADAEFTAPAPRWTWFSIPSEQHCPTFSSQLGTPTTTITNLSYPGDYVFKATGDWNSDEIVVTVLDHVLIDRIIEDGSDPEDQGPLYVSVDSTVRLRAIPSPGEADFPAGNPMWSIETYPSGTNSILNDNSGATTDLSGLSTPGEYVIRADCEDSSDTIRIIVVNGVTVDRVVKDESDPEDQGPLYVGRDGSVTLRAMPSPVGEDFPAGEPTWSIESHPSGANASLSSGSPPVTVVLSNLSVVGDYIVKASCGGHGDTIKVTVVPGVVVDRIIKDGSDPEDQGPLCVDINGSVVLRAKPSPENTSFPAGQPTWIIQTQPAGADAHLSETSGEAIGETITLMDLFVPGKYVVRASCGGHSDTIEVVLGNFGLSMSPASGPIGTVVTLTLSPPGTGLLSDSTTVSIAGQYEPLGYSTTTTGTIEYPASKVHFDPARPDEVKIVIGDVLPSVLWLSANPQVYLANSGVLTGFITLNVGEVTCTNIAQAASFQLYTEAELGTLEGTTFTPVGLIASGQQLIAQVLIKDDGLGFAPDSLTVTLQSCDAANNPIGAPPTEDYADSSLTLVLNHVATGGISGFHTYRSSSDDPIMPYAFELPIGASLDGNKYIYIASEGSLMIRY